MKKWLTSTQLELREEYKFFLKKSIKQYFIKVDRIVYKTANKSSSIDTKEFLLSSNRPELSPWSFTHVFKTFKLLWGEIAWKELRFLQITAKHQDFSYHISNDKNFNPKYPDNALIDSVLTSRTSRRLLENIGTLNVHELFLMLRCNASV